MTEPTPERERLRQLLADAVRAAAYACEGDCGLTEAECRTAHPIQALHGDVVTARVDALADVILPLIEDARPAGCTCGSTLRALPTRGLIHYADCPAREQAGAE